MSAESLRQYRHMK